MRLVLDTNVVASGLLWGGVPAQLLDAAQVGEIELFISRPLLAELSNILARGKFAEAIAATGLPRDELVLGYAGLTLAANADWIVSGDKHLHNLGGQYKGIKIVRPADAVRLIAAT